MTRQEIKQKHGNLPEPVIQLILLLGEEAVKWLIELSKAAREKRIAKRKAKENGKDAGTSK